MNEKIKKIIYNEVTLVIAVFSFAWGIFNYLNSPQIKVSDDISKIHTDVALINQSIGVIKNNHEAHIQQILEEIKALKELDQKLNERIEKQNEAIIRLLTIHPEIK